MSTDHEWVSLVAPRNRRRNSTSLNEWYKVPEVSHKKGKSLNQERQARQALESGKTIDDWYVVPEIYALGNHGINSKKTGNSKSFQSKVIPSFDAIGKFASTFNRNVSSSVTKASDGMKSTWKSNLYPRMEAARVSRLVAADRKEMRKTPGITAAQFLERKYGKDAVPRLEQGRSL